MARPDGPGSQATPGAATASPPNGFDPSRVVLAMRRYLSEARKEGVVPVAWHLSEAVAQGLSSDSARPATLLGLKICIHDEWSWGWMMTAKRHHYDFDSGAAFWNPRCDSDRSGEAGETVKQGSTVGESAGLQGIAQPHRATPSSGRPANG